MSNSPALPFCLEETERSYNFLMFLETFNLMTPSVQPLVFITPSKEQSEDDDNLPVTVCNTTSNSLQSSPSLGLIHATRHWNLHSLCRGQQLLHGPYPPGNEYFLVYKLPYQCLMHQLFPVCWSEDIWISVVSNNTFIQ